MKAETFFPEIIMNHSNADLPVDGVESYLIQAGQQQFIFMEFDRDVEVPDHSHNAQWGEVLDGEIELTIAGEPKVLKRGDTYYIDKGMRHSAKIKQGYKDLTLFDQADRYKTKLF